MAVISVSLPDERLAFLDEEIASGGFKSASDFISALLLAEQLRKNQEQVDALLLEAEEETADPIAGGPGFWANMHKELDEFIRTEALQ